MNTAKKQKNWSAALKMGADEGQVFLCRVVTGESAVAVIRLRHPFSGGLDALEHEEERLPLPIRG